MKSKVTSKYQTTIPKEVRDRLNLNISDSIEWKIESDKILVEPVNKPFLKYKGSIKIKSGNIREDVLLSRKRRVLNKK